MKGSGKKCLLSFLETIGTEKKKKKEPINQGDVFAQSPSIVLLFNKLSMNRKIKALIKKKNEKAFQNSAVLSNNYYMSDKSS